MPIDPLKPPREDESIDAFLLIGDNALREPPGEHYVLDLGEEWRNFYRVCHSSMRSGCSDRERETQRPPRFCRTRKKRAWGR